MLPHIFAYDTETGRVGPAEEDIRTVLIQTCDKDAVSIDQVRLYVGTDCFDRFFDEFEGSNDYKQYECFVYNLRYEFPWMLPYLIERYQWKPRERNPLTNRKLKMDPSTWWCMQDDMTVYTVEICNRYGSVLRIRDDLRRGPPVSMKEAAENVRREHPEWWPSDEVKTNVDELYNDWWTLPSCCYEFRRFMEYSRLDAYSQAMICRYYYDQMGNRKLTINSYSLDRALCMTYDEDSVFRAKKRFFWDFPPLNRRMQDIVENGLLGGFVYAVPGEWKGTFVHVDYSSSYPYEYMYGRLFKGKHIEKNSWSVMDDPFFFKWYIVSFDFELKDTGMPLLSFGECEAQFYDVKGSGKSLKMRSGRVAHKLMTDTYWKELQEHYYIKDPVIEEMWSAPVERGKFALFIRDCYEHKQLPELKGTMLRDLYKRQMNAGIHGKTITKTHRTEVSYPDGEKMISKVVTDPSYCSLIGFTAMMNARERLARHCRILQEHGVRVMQCDTDSIVAEGTEQQVREILGDSAFYVSGKIGTELGRFEFETFKGRAEFDTFRSWGLKRYCEIQDGEYRKSAFAGMHEEQQKAVLMTAPMDGSYFYWTQKKTKRLMEEEAIIGRMVYKDKMKACLEDIWYHEKDLEYELKKANEMLEFYGRDYDEDMVSYLQDIRQDEKDRYWKRHVKKSFEKQKWDEVRQWEW